MKKFFSTFLVLLFVSIVWAQSIDYEKIIQDACPAAAERNFAAWKKGLSSYDLLLVNLTITYKKTSENPAIFLNRDEKIVIGTMVSGIITATAFCQTSGNFKKRLINKKLVHHFFNGNKVERVIVTGQEYELKTGWDESILI